MEHILYWLWLTTKFRIAGTHAARLFERFDSIEDIYFSKNYNNIYGIKEKERSLLLDKDLTKAKKELEGIYTLGGKIIAYDSENYPQILKNIPDPPYLLYIMGKLPELDEVLTIGVVGTRRASDYGNLVTERICADLADAGAVTINGLATGIDAVGAWSTIERGGISVGVIGCGIDKVYPRDNAELYAAMTEKGCIMSEFPLGTAPIGTNFPIRNRIIAGLSRGVLVTEAPPKSGALITARFALENNRDVFAVPRDITDARFTGTNILIQQGAKLVMSADDILSEYPYAKRVRPDRENAPKRKRASAPKTESAQNDTEKTQNEEKTEKTAIKPKAVNTQNSEQYKNLTGGDREIVDMLRKSDLHIDEISRGTGIPVGELNTRLVMLEMKGHVERLPGGRYQIKI